VMRSSTFLFSKSLANKAGQYDCTLTLAALHKVAILSACCPLVKDYFPNTPQSSTLETISKKHKCLNRTKRQHIIKDNKQKALRKYCEHAKAAAKNNQPKELDTILFLRLHKGRCTTPIVYITQLRKQKL